MREDLSGEELNKRKQQNPPNYGLSSVIRRVALCVGEKLLLFDFVAQLDDAFERFHGRVAVIGLFVVAEFFILD